MWRNAPQRHARLGLLLLAALLALGAASTAAADGEAGLVIQDGETVTTYCVPFQGDGIRGDDLLRAAGHTYDAYGGGSGLAVCSINQRGCEDAGSFSSCFCECQGSSCTYWAFFTRAYGKPWVYSTLAFNLLEARDGEVHGWKWGQGAPNSAPAPRDVTFEHICGHAPRGGAAPTATAPPPTAIATTPAATTPPLTTTTEVATATGPSTAAPPSATPPLVTITNAAPTAAGSAVTTPEAPASGDDDEEAGPGGSLLVFGTMAALLVALLGAGLVWRSRHAA